MAKSLGKSEVEKILNLYTEIIKAKESGEFQRMVDFFEPYSSSTRASDILKFFEEFYNACESKGLHSVAPYFKDWNQTSDLAKDVIESVNEINEEVGGVAFNILKNNGSVSPYSMGFDIVKLQYEACVAKSKLSAEDPLKSVEQNILNAFNDKLSVLTDMVYARIMAGIKDKDKIEELDRTTFQHLYDDIDEAKKVAQDIKDMLNGNYADIPALLQLADDIVEQLNEKVEPISSSISSLSTETRENLNEVKGSINTLNSKVTLSSEEVVKQINAHADELAKQINAHADELAKQIADNVNTASYTLAEDAKKHTTNEAKRVITELGEKIDEKGDVILEAIKESDLPEDIKKKIIKKYSHTKLKTAGKIAVAALIIAGATTAAVFAALDYFNGDGSASNVTNIVTNLTEDQIRQIAQGYEASGVVLALDGLDSLYNENANTNNNTVSLKLNTGSNKVALTSYTGSNGEYQTMLEYLANEVTVSDEGSITINGVTLNLKDISDLGTYSDIVYDAIDEYTSSTDATDATIDNYVNNVTTVLGLDDSVMKDFYGATTYTSSVATINTLYQSGETLESLASQIQTTYETVCPDGTATDTATQLNEIISKYKSKISETETELSTYEGFISNLFNNIGESYKTASDGSYSSMYNCVVTYYADIKQLAETGTTEADALKVFNDKYGTSYESLDAIKEAIDSGEVTESDVIKYINTNLGTSFSSLSDLKTALEAASSGSDSVTITLEDGSTKTLTISDILDLYNNYNTLLDDYYDLQKKNEVYEALLGISSSAGDSSNTKDDENNKTTSKATVSGVYYGM